MAFSFNWAGTNIGQIDPNQSRQAYDDAKNLGEAAAGLRKRIGMSKYADLIRNGSGSNDARIAEIQAEISRLEARNKELQGLMSQQVPVVDEDVQTMMNATQADKQSVADMMARDQALRAQRAGYMVPGTDQRTVSNYDGIYAPAGISAYEMLKLFQTQR